MSNISKDNVVKNKEKEKFMSRVKRALAMFMTMVLFLFSIPASSIYAYNNTGTSENYSTVYADGTKENSGDGKSADTAVNNLEDAYKKLDPNAGGTIVICGDVEISKDLNLESLNITGKVTLTSVTGAEDYRESAALVLNGGLQLALTDSTVMDKMNIRTVAGKGSQLIYSGLDLDIKDTVTCTGNGTLKIFCGRMQDTTDQTINVSVYGGTFNQIFMGSHTKYNTGNVNLSVGGNISVTSNVAFGSNTTNSKDLNFTMNGGYVKVLYDTPSSSTTKAGKTGNVTANLNSGTITEMRDYNGKSGMQMGDITINVSSAFNCGSAQFGVWSSGAVTTGKKTLNIYNYQGENINSLENYDVVNVFGGEIPSGFNTSGDNKSLNIYNCNGILGLNINSFEKIAATNSNITFPGKVSSVVGTNSAKLKLVANDGAVLRIRSSQNPGVTKQDYNITENGSGKVVLEEPAYEGNDIVLDVDFNNKTAADSSLQNNSGVVSGNPDFVESYDGSNAIYINNAFGENNASQYVTFKDLKGIDITKDDFTISFWYQTVNGGTTEWAKASQAAIAGSGVDIKNAYVGGIVFSNQDVVNDTDGISAAQFAQAEFFTMGLTDKNGVHYDKDGIRKAIDDSWHMVCVTYDRDANYKVYVDDSLLAVVDIASLKDQQLGVDTLVLGADINGKYGLENAYIDDLKIYNGAMKQVDVQANFYIDRLNGLVNSIDKRVSELGSEYDVYKADMLAKNEKAKETVNSISVKDYDKAVTLYQELKNDYETFLLAPQKDAKLSSLLISDIHITKEGDSDSVKLESVFSDIANNNIKVDTMINTGDFGDNSQAETTKAAYEEFLRLSKKYNLEDMMMIAAYGNHEIQYTDENANYKTSTPVYWEYIMNHINEFVQKGEAKIDYINHDSQYNSNSYSVTYKGYHFLVLNGDYMEQTGDSSTYKDENGNYSIEGNQYDPIRHGAHFYESTLDWVKKVMDDYSKDDLPIFVLNHFPFIDSVPLSYYDEIVINDNSIGKQDPQLRRILGNYDNVYYFCGHLHSSFGMNEPVKVVSDNGGSFTELNLPAIKGAARSYANVPASWIMYVYDDEIVLRARDFTTGEWLPQYDEVLKLKKDAQISDDNAEEETNIKEEINTKEVTNTKEETKSQIKSDSGDNNSIAGQTVSADKSSSSVQTGDNSEVVLLSILLIISVLSAGIIVVRKKFYSDNGQKI